MSNAAHENNGVVIWFGPVKLVGNLDKTGLSRVLGKEAHLERVQSPY